jgi:serine/threonine protein kinase
LEQRQPVRDEPVIVGRYAIYDRIAAGGMATVHLGRLVGEHGFSRTVAIKRLHPHLAMDPDFVGMFLDEARLAARIRHPNVVQMLDVVVRDDEVFLVMEYIEGESLSQFMRLCISRSERVPASAAVAVVSSVLRGLHAAHEAKNDHGEPLGMVHRDVSPQNVLLDLEGVARVLDFGVAKALGQSHATQAGQLKGKLAYMAPEQITGGAVDRRTALFAAAVVLWEMVCGRRLFKADGDAQVMHLVLNEPIRPPSTVAPDITAALDAVVLRALERDPAKRFPTAEAFADALEDAVAPMGARKLGAWVRILLGDNVAKRARLVHDIESKSTGQHVIPLPLLKPIDDSVDVDLLLEADPPPLPVGSQASSIAVAAPGSISAITRKPSTRSLLAVGGAVCVVVLVAGIAVRGLRQKASATSPTNATAASPATTATPASAPSAAASAAVPDSVPFDSLPIAPPQPEDSANAAPVPVKTVALPTKASHAVTSRPAAPAASSKLYSRF